MTPPHNAPPAGGAYLRWLLVSAAIGMLVVLAFNALIDPLGISPLRIGIPGINLLKPLRANFDRLVKPYDVRTKLPRTLFIGSSLVKQAVDPTQLNGLPLAPAYNAGVDNGANLEENRRLIEYYLSVDPNIRTIYIELFLTAILQIQDITPQPPIDSLELLRDRILALISGTAFRYSIETILYNRAAHSPPVASFDTGFVPVPATTWRISVDNIPDQLYRNRIIDPAHKASMASVNAAREIAELCRRHQVDCRFFIAPLHSDVLYGAYFAGLWDELVKLKTAFARVAPTYDFSRYNDLIDERSGPVVYWWEAFHFSPALGSHMVHVMAGSRPSGVPDNFGVLLNADNVDEETRAWTRERDRWIARYPLIRARYEAARNNNQKAASYTGVLHESNGELVLDMTSYRIVERGAGMVEYCGGVPRHAIGWVGDTAARKAARALAIFQGEQLAAYVEPNLPRPDIAQDKNSLLSYGGFYARMDGKTSNALRAFALYDDATASELDYAPAATCFRSLRPKAKQKKELATQ